MNGWTIGTLRPTTNRNMYTLLVWQPTKGLQAIVTIWVDFSTGASRFYGIPTTPRLDDLRRSLVLHVNRYFAAWLAGGGVL